MFSFDREFYFEGEGENEGMRNYFGIGRNSFQLCSVPISEFQNRFHSIQHRGIGNILVALLGSRFLILHGLYLQISNTWLHLQMCTMKKFVHLWTKSIKLEHC